MSEDSMEGEDVTVKPSANGDGWEAVSKSHPHLCVWGDTKESALEMMRSEIERQDKG